MLKAKKHIELFANIFNVFLFCYCFFFSSCLCLVINQLVTITKLVFLLSSSAILQAIIFLFFFVALQLLKIVKISAIFSKPLSVKSLMVINDRPHYIERFLKRLIQYKVLY